MRQALMYDNCKDYHKLYYNILITAIRKSLLGTVNHHLTRYQEFKIKGSFAAKLALWNSVWEFP